MFDHTIFNPGNERYDARFKPGLYWIKSLDEGDHYLIDVDNNDKTLSFNSTDGYIHHADGAVINLKSSGIGKHFIGILDYSSGFLSKVNYSGNGKHQQNLPHDLKTHPEFVLFKSNSCLGDWVAWHYSFGFAGYLKFNTDDKFIEDKMIFDKNLQNKRTLTVAGKLNTLNENYTSYMFGNSKFFDSGFYLGKKNLTVSTKVKPELLIIKRVDGIGSWRMFSSKLNSGDSLRINSFGKLTENDDLLSVNLMENGFKIQQECSAINQENAKYIYLAFSS